LAGPDPDYDPTFVTRHVLAYGLIWFALMAGGAWFASVTNSPWPLTPAFLAAFLAFLI
jgi:hypothetical protein